MALSDRIMYDLTLWCNSRGYSEPSLGFYSAPNMPLYRHVLQHPLEIKAYIDVLEPLDPREITLEIGLHRGGTHFVWQQLFQEVISVDNNYWWCCKASVEFPSVRSKIVYGNSQDVECVQTVAHILDGRLVDHLFIDGEHIYERIFSDLLNYSKFVRPGGIIAFHDSRDSAVFPVMEDLQYGRLTGWPATKMSEINAPEGDQPPGITYFYGDRPPGICYFYKKE